MATRASFNNIGRFMSILDKPPFVWITGGSNKKNDLPPAPIPGESDVIPFTKEAVRDYLVSAIISWRVQRDEHDPDDRQHIMAVYYIDAYQSVHISLFGTMVPL